MNLNFKSICMLITFALPLIGIAKGGVVNYQRYDSNENDCPKSHYYDFQEQRCRKFFGGGQAVLIDHSTRCSDDYIGLRSHPSNLHYYYLCRSDSVIIGLCNGTDVFSDEKKYCVENSKKPTIATRKDDKILKSLDVPRCHKPGIFILPQNDTYFYKCCKRSGHFKQKIYRCPDNMKYNLLTKECSFGGENQLPIQIGHKGWDQFPDCQLPGRFRTPNDCTKYYICSARTGGHYYQIRFRCPVGFHYSIEAEKCLDAKYIKCKLLSNEEIIQRYQEKHPEMEIPVYAEQSDETDDDYYDDNYGYDDKSTGIDEDDYSEDDYYGNDSYDLDNSFSNDWDLSTFNEYLIDDKDVLISRIHVVGDVPNTLQPSLDQKDVDEDSKIELGQPIIKSETPNASKLDTKDNTEDSQIENGQQANVANDLLTQKQETVPTVDVTNAHIETVPEVGKEVTELKDYTDEQLPDLKPIETPKTEIVRSPQTDEKTENELQNIPEVTEAKPLNVGQAIALGEVENQSLPTVEDKLKEETAVDLPELHARSVEDEENEPKEISPIDDDEISSVEVAESVLPENIPDGQQDIPQLGIGNLKADATEKETFPTVDDVSSPSFEEKIEEIFVIPKEENADDTPASISENVQPIVPPTTPENQSQQMSEIQPVNVEAVKEVPSAIENENDDEVTTSETGAKAIQQNPSVSNVEAPIAVATEDLSPVSLDDKPQESTAETPVNMSPEKTEPVAPELVAAEPVATEAVATEAAATKPAATEAVAAEPVAAEPVATEPVATEAVATEPVATEPVATEPITTEAVANEAVATEPVAAEPVATEPIATEAVANEAVATEPVAAEPVATEPVAAEPVGTEPVATEAVAPEPVATEPVATEAVATEAAATKPAATEAVSTEPAATEAVATEPAATEAVSTEPEATEAIASEPVATEPTITEPIATVPVVTEPVVAAPVAPVPVSTEPLNDKQKLEETMDDIPSDGNKNSETAASNSQIVETAEIPKQVKAEEMKNVEPIVDVPTNPEAISEGPELTTDEKTDETPEHKEEIKNDESLVEIPAILEEISDISDNENEDEATAGEKVAEKPVSTDDQTGDNQKLPEPINETETDDSESLVEIPSITEEISAIPDNENEDKTTEVDETLAPTDIANVDVPETKEIVNKEGEKDIETVADIPTIDEEISAIPDDENEEEDTAGEELNETPSSPDVKTGDVPETTEAVNKEDDKGTETAAEIPTTHEIIPEIPEKENADEATRSEIGHVTSSLVDNAEDPPKPVQEVEMKDIQPVSENPTEISELDKGNEEEVKPSQPADQIPATSDNMPEIPELEKGNEEEVKANQSADETPEISELGKGNEEEVKADQPPDLVPFIPELINGDVNTKDSTVENVSNKENEGEAVSPIEDTVDENVDTSDIENADETPAVEPIMDDDVSGISDEHIPETIPALTTDDDASTLEVEDTSLPDKVSEMSEPTELKNEDVHIIDESITSPEDIVDIPQIGSEDKPSEVQTIDEIPTLPASEATASNPLDTETVTLSASNADEMPEVAPINDDIPTKDVAETEIPETQNEGEATEDAPVNVSSISPEIPTVETITETTQGTEEHSDVHEDETSSASQTKDGNSPSSDSKPENIPAPVTVHETSTDQISAVINEELSTRPVDEPVLESPENVSDVPDVENVEDSPPVQIEEEITTSPDGKPKEIQESVNEGETSATNPPISATELVNAETGAQSVDNIPANVHSEPINKEEHAAEQSLGEILASSVDKPEGTEPIQTTENERDAAVPTPSVADSIGNDDVMILPRSDEEETPINEPEKHDSLSFKLVDSGEDVDKEELEVFDQKKEENLQKQAVSLSDIILSKPAVVQSQSSPIDGTTLDKYYFLKPTAETSPNNFCDCCKRCHSTGIVEPSSKNELDNSYVHLNVKHPCKLVINIDHGTTCTCKCTEQLKE